MQGYERPGDNVVMTLIYTSGTTGYPKGVMMSYQNVSWVAQSFYEKLPASEADERLFSYLPLAHLFERAVIEIGSLLWCAEVHFLESPEKFAQRLKQVAPTRFFSVPAVWIRMARVVQKRIPEVVLNVALKIPSLRGVVQRMLRRKLGLQNVHMAVSGAAALPVPVLSWFGRALGLNIQEGYGMTENGAYVALSVPGESGPGTVGKPFSDTCFRLAADDEIQVKHPGVMLGYYRAPEDTARTFTSDGWLRTGDTGELDAQGDLKITGRTKDIFKTLKGKYVAPAAIEARLAVLPWVEHVCVLGANRYGPIALVRPAPAFSASHYHACIPYARRALSELNADLEPHEQLEAIYLSTDLWSIDNGVLTPTLKIRRQQVEMMFAARADLFWQEGAGVFLQRPLNPNK